MTQQAPGSIPSPTKNKKLKRMVISLTSCQANSSEKLVSYTDSMKERVALRLSGGSQAPQPGLSN